ncbi:MAG: membrane protein insertase YidC [Pseudomonadota bacterium]
MDNQRLFAWALFGLLLMMTWQAWQQDYATPPAAAAITEAAQPELVPVDDVLPEVPATPAAASDAVPTTGENVLPTAPAAVASSATYVAVKTDVLHLKINLAGGDIVSASLPRYPVSKDLPDQKVTLLNDAGDRYGVYRTGLTSGNNESDPNHLATWQSEASSYTLADGADTLVVPLTWTNDAGVSVEKRFVFKRGAYRIDVNFDVTNATDTAWTARPYARIVHAAEAPDRSMFNVESYSFKGPVVFDGEKYEKHSPEDLGGEPVRLNDVQNGWVAAIEHHFLSAIIPPADTPVRIDAARSGERFVVGTVSPAISVAANSTATIPVTLFTGPKLQEQLEAISPRLPLTVDYGMLTLLADPLFWLLSAVYGFVGNWGWAIIIVTFLIKLVFYKLTEKSGRSIAKMRKLQPRLKAIQERYADDRQKLSQAMMELYKREKVNPAAGCLPILIQMPFFLAFYWVLLESVEMRQAPFMLWIQDLSVRDPLFVLPILMGAAMLMQQRLNPAPADPVQAKVMRVLPVIFTVFFAFFPAGLVLYWFTNTVLGVAQQWKINNVVEAEERKQRD